jgi:hypothetical protein
MVMGIVTGLYACAGGSSTPVQPTAHPVATATAPPPIAIDAAADEDAGDASAEDASQAEASSQPILLASGQSASGALIADDTHVYWIDEADGSLNNVSRGGPGGAILMMCSAPSAFLAPSNLVTDGDFIYWTQQIATGGFVMKIDKGGGKPVELVSKIKDPVHGAAIDATNVYWIQGSSIMKVAKRGGTPTTVANAGMQATPTSLAVDASNVYFTTVAASMDDAGTAKGSVMKVPTSGGTPTTLAADQDTPAGLIIDASSAIWISRTTIRWVAKSGGTVTDLPLPNTSQVVDLGVDAKYIYWTRESPDGTGSVGRMPKDASKPPVDLFASKESSPVGVAVDAVNVYWTSRGTLAHQFRDGNVMMLPLPEGGQ